MHNSISRCEESLEAFEKNLGMLKRDGEVDAVLDRTIGAIEAGLSTGRWPEETFTEILAQLKKTRKAD